MKHQCQKCGTFLKYKARRCPYCCGKVQKVTGRPSWMTTHAPVIVGGSGSGQIADGQPVRIAATE